MSNRPKGTWGENPQRSLKKARFQKQFRRPQKNNDVSDGGGGDFIVFVLILIFLLFVLALW